MVALPVAVAIAIAAVAAAAASSAGAIVSSQAQANQLDYQKDVAKQQGEQARQEAAAEEAAVRRKALFTRGQQEAAFAASGVTLEGSPLAALEDTAVQSELDALSTRYQGAGQLWKQKAQARLYGAQAESTRTQGYFEGGSKLLGGLAEAGGMYATTKSKQQQA
jgi:hypothetical protein